MTVKAFINQQGGTRSKSLSQEATLLLDWVEINLQSIIAEHLAVLDNMQADWLSLCRLREMEWQLNPLVFREIQRQFGVPEVDLFTAANNAQLPRFFSRGQQEGAEAVDTLQNAWP